MAAINTLRPRQDGRHFADDIFKCIFLNENVWIPIKISLNFVTKGPINNIPVLVPIMAWCRPDDKPLSEPMMVSLLTHICVTRPQWVNRLKDPPTWLKVTTTQEIDLQPWAPRQWTSTTTRRQCGPILLPSLTLRSHRGNPPDQKTPNARITSKCDQLRTDLRVEKFWISWTREQSLNFYHQITS